MNFLPNNKWVALLVFVLIVMVAVVVALSFVKIKPDTKNLGDFRFSLGVDKKVPAKA